VIHDIAVDWGEERFATATAEGRVTIWSQATRGSVAEFASVFAFGGNRLALLAAPVPLVVVAAYSRKGIQAHDLGGVVRWSRRDLKRVQTVRALHLKSHGPVVGVGFGDAPFLLLDPATGLTRDRLRGVRDVYASPESPLTVFVREGRIEIKVAETVRRVSLTSFAVLDIGLSSEAVLVSEAGGDLRCFSPEARQSWRWSPGRGVHGLSVAWQRARRVWLAAVWPFERGGPLACVTLSPSGSKLANNAVGTGWVPRFMADGEALITSEAVYDTLAFRELWKLATQE
jgi:hypothetical protein